MNSQSHVLENGLPPPPIPHRLRELLADYPQHIDRLQESLNSVVDGPRRVKGSPHRVFEVAIWALEGQLDAFIREAQEELEKAKASGLAAHVSRSDAKYSLMLRSRSGNAGMKGLHDLWRFFEEHQEALA